MLTLQLLGLGLLVHESVYFASKGTKHFIDGCNPVLSLSMPTACRVGTHCLFVLCSVGLIVAPALLWSRFGALVLTTLIIASFPSRLPNHLPVAWMVLASFCLSPDNGVAVAITQIVVLMAYWFAALHKLNTEYFHRSRSCGVGLLTEYLLRKRVFKRWMTEGIYCIGTYGVVATELLLPLGLLFEPTRALALIVATFMHVAFGILAHANFSIIMFACLSTFVASEVPISTLAAVVAVIFATIASPLLSIHRFFQFPWLTLINSWLVLAVGTCGAIISVNHAVGELHITRAFAATPVFSLLTFVFFVNCASPYLGLKFDFSLAMFSNLHPLRSTHFFLSLPKWSLAPKYLLMPTIALIDSSACSLGVHTEQHFPMSGSHAFSVGYVASVAKQLGPRFVVVATDGANGYWIFRGPESNRRLRARDRVSVFPYSVPLSNDEPLCM